MLNVKHLADSEYPLAGFIHFNFLMPYFGDISVKFYLFAF